MNILITGAGRGLGAALTKAAADRGHKILAGSRSTDHEGLRSLMEQYPEQVIPLQLDVQDEQSVQAAAAKVQELGYRVDAIINNAAILLGRDSKLEQLDMQEMIESMDVNLYGPMRVVKHFLPLLKQSGSGSCIMNISSEAGSFSRAYGGDYPYALSKAALNYFTQQLYKDLARDGIRAIAVHPGWMRTDMGGANAALDPQTSAIALIEIIEGKQVELEPYAFIDYTGKSFPI